MPGRRPPFVLFALVLALPGCTQRTSGGTLLVAGSTAEMAAFIAKERSCRPALRMTRARAEAGTQSAVLVEVPRGYSPAARAQLRREATAAGLRTR